MRLGRIDCHSVPPVRPIGSILMIMKVTAFWQSIQKPVKLLVSSAMNDFLKSVVKIGGISLIG
jgi:hypothetical protein